ncbi:hypothetical protein SAY87_008710 [Trapa incisa]|uniref:Transducin/WD40 repeat-like superfamily protein n=1 Tax=Trapa incisa TaxID=236973 RepID=A0AAN7PWL2_9MYRT|nr:hypothetical protein SAY87_008710 [Trapa incisa]
MSPPYFSCDSTGVEVLPFDCSVENHFQAVDIITKLCGEEDTSASNDEITRISSSIKFLREWKLFNYAPRDVKFSSQPCNAAEREALTSISLTQFSSLTVPKMQDKKLEGSADAEQRKDFVMYVGGSVWALDWCPRDNGMPSCQISQEFIAVAAHPPGSSYHKLGYPLTGRGIIQIWSLLNVMRSGEVAPSVKKTKQKRKNAATTKDKLLQPKRPRGRPRKDSLAIVHSDNNCAHSSAVQVGSSGKLESDSKETASLEENNFLSTKEGDEESRYYSRNNSATQEMAVEDSSSDISPVVSYFPKDIALPRLVLCLAHNGKVAWDVKWRPTYNEQGSKCSCRMGYLAVVLGNGSLEVWEIPMLKTMKHVYSCMKTDGIDPRFVKIEPVFKCSKITSGGSQSIPLTVEWSPSSLQQEYLIAGCHDGTVALWKFSANDSPKDTRPLLRFTADTAPIRAVAWAPNGSDLECVNVIATAGHGGVKFWDIRDPFCPLWDLNSAQKIYSLDWPHDPRCIILSYDDGTLKFLSMTRSVNDLPITGKPCVRTKQQGLHTFECSSFPNWSVHVSRSTGMVAYSSADGTVHHFQLTSKAVDKDHSRNRSPHFLCVSVTASKDGSAIILNDAPSETPIILKRSQKVVDTENSISLRNSEELNMDDEPLALCYEGGATESEETKNKKQRSHESASSKMGVQVTRGEEKAGAYAKNLESLPPKIVAMNRVRWNMNNGSDRWLCSGGAAGIVRCQMI